MAHLNFPPPTDHQEFERLVGEIADPALRASHVNLNGRTGQAQQGVDVSVLTNDGRHVGIQCKLTNSGLSLGTVKAEIQKARGYKPALDRFIVATTAPSDARLQEDVRLLPKEKFSVEIWSWDEINNHLNRLGALGVAYAQHVLMGPAEDAERQHAEHLREALDRPAFLRMAHSERNFIDQREAVKDTSAFLRTGYLYTRDNRFVSGLPHRRYGEDYSASLSTILRAVDALDAFLGRHAKVLMDQAAVEHAEAIVDLDTRRMAVLKAANRAFARLDIAELSPELWP